MGILVHNPYFHCEMPISVLIVEDEFIIAEDISSALISNGYRIFGIADTYAQALELLKKGRPDFALLDITLEGEQWGLKLGKMLSEDLNVPFIYVTSHSDIATIEKVKITNPSGFLLKPFNRESIYTSIEVAMASFNNRKSEGDEEQAFYLKQGTKRIKVLFSETLYLEADGNYTNIYTLNNRYTERKKLKELMDEWTGHPFIRVHKSFAVNKNKINNLSRDRMIIAGNEIPVGRTYLEELESYFH
jgi:DNA-binding LytR/AlgR family response regulator